MPETLQHIRISNHMSARDLVQALAHNKLVDEALREQRGMMICPTCEGDAVRYVSGPSWGYWGGSDVEYATCPECEGEGEVPDDDA